MKSNERNKLVISNNTSIVSNILKDINDANDNDRITHYEEVVSTKRNISTKKCSISYIDKDGVICSFKFERKYTYKEGDENGNDNGPQ